MSNRIVFGLLKIMMVTLLPAQAISQSGDSQRWRDIKVLLPTSTNAILAINAEAMFESELAIKSDWRELHAEHFGRNPTMLPPNASRFVLATELDTEHFEPTRELAVIATSSPVQFDDLPMRIEGEFDSIAGLRAYHTVRDSYVVSIDEQMVALVRLAPRHWAVQQLRHGRERTTDQLPEILSRAIDQVAAGSSQIALAVHLKDAAPRSAIKAMIDRSGVLGETTQNGRSLVDEMMQLEGIVFTIDIKDAIHGRLSMVFDGEPKHLSAFAKPIMLELLTSAGAVLPEFKQWQAASGSNALALEGELSIEGLRRVLSLLSVQPTDLESETPLTESTPSIKPDPEEVKRKATENFVKRVTRLANAVVSGARGGNLREQVLWTDRTAKTILRMSPKNVHYDAVKLSRQIAYQMLDIVSIFQEADQKAQARIVIENPPTVQWRTEMIPYSGFNTPYGRLYRYRPFSYAQVFAVENAIHSRQVYSEELGNATAAAKDVVTKIEGDVARLSELPQ